LEEHAPHNPAAEVFPQRPVRNPELRSQRVRAQASETPAKTTQVRSRMVPVGYGIAKEEARLYLREQYTNENSIMFCQACRSSLPFRLASGEHYFEAVDAFVNGSKRFRESFLAMCPNHSAMFEHANAARETFFELIAEATEPMIEIVLAGNQVTIEFTEQHLIDIQVCLDSLTHEQTACDK
jgi:hypothetical protein